MMSSEQQRGAGSNAGPADSAMQEGLQGGQVPHRRQQSPAGAAAGGAEGEGHAWPPSGTWASDLSKVRLMIATPAYGGMVTATYALSLFHLQSALTSHGVQHEVKLLSNESLIPRARNTLCAYFLRGMNDGRGPHFTHLLFVDADIGFAPQAVLRLLAFNEPVCCGAYPCKIMDFAQGVRAASRLYAGADPAQVPMHQLCLKYAVNFSSGPGDKPRAVRDGFLESLDGATGFMCIQRQALERIIDDRGDSIKYVNDLTGMDALNDHMYDFFQCFIDPDSRRYLSEDYGFCRRWQQLGGKIWIDLTSRLTHTGTTTFQGDVPLLVSHMRRVSA